MDDEEKIDLVLKWAENVPEFDITFIESLKDYYDQHSELTFAQSEALDRIIKKWNIDID